MPLKRLRKFRLRRNCFVIFFLFDYSFQLGVCTFNFSRRWIIDDVLSPQQYYNIFHFWVNHDKFDWLSFGELLDKIETLSVCWVFASSDSNKRVQPISFSTQESKRFIYMIMAFYETQVLIFRFLTSSTVGYFSPLFGCPGCLGAKIHVVSLSSTHVLFRLIFLIDWSCQRTENNFSLWTF